MVKYCAVALCTNGTHNRPDLSYFVFPSDRNQLKSWRAFCRRGDSMFKTLVDPRICSLHFSSKDIKNSFQGRRSLVKGSIPSIFNLKEVDSESSDRSRRSLSRDINKRKSSTNTVCKEPSKKKASFETVEVIQDCEVVEMCESPVQHQANLSSNVVVADHCYAGHTRLGECEGNEAKYPLNTQNSACQTDLTLKTMALLEEDLKTLKNKSQNLSKKLDNKRALKRELNLEDILNDDESVRFYTNIPNLRTLNLILELTTPYAEKIKYWDKKKKSKSHYQKAPEKNKPGRKRQLSVTEEFVLVLVRLRLGLLNRHLGQMFGVSETSVSKICTTWICLLSKLFQDTLLRWPSRDEILKHMPKSFKRYPKTRVVIDATEFFIDKPTSPSAQKATWSEYKHHNTMKLLVGIAPCGSFTFVSKLWSGSTSDRKITQESGLIELLEEGDNVMADRGFNIRDLLTRNGVELNLPPFSKGKQLSRKARNDTASIAKVRIHVERAIERLKNFRILEGNIPLTMVGVADHIVIVCAALCNLLPPLAK